MITIHLRFTDAFGYNICYWQRLILFQKNSVEWYSRTPPYGYLRKTDTSLLRSFILVLKIQVIQFLPLYYGQLSWSQSYQKSYNPYLYNVLFKKISIPFSPPPPPQRTPSTPPEFPVLLHTFLEKFWPPARNFE